MSSKYDDDDDDSKHNEVEEREKFTSREEKYNEEG
jgi:hypothetical protein